MYSLISKKEKNQILRLFRQKLGKNYLDEIFLILFPLDSSDENKILFSYDYSLFEILFQDLKII